MTLSVTTAAQSTLLTTVKRVQDEMGLSAGTDDALIRGLIVSYSASIANYCHRGFGREVYVETTGGFGGIRLQLARTPIVALSTVYADTTLYTDVTVMDADKGWLYRRLGFASTAQRYLGLTGSGAFLDYGYPMDRQEEPSFSVTYTAGYLMPEQNRLGGTVSVSAVDNSFNDADSRFPLLVAGDVVVAEGFSLGGNPGRHIVTGTPTAAKVVVTSTLTTESASANAIVRFEPPAQCRPFADVEKACVEAVKSAYINRRDDSGIIEKAAGPMRIRYSEGQDGLALGLPSICVGLLRPWVRAA
jgi:hypothetical protein